MDAVGRRVLAGDRARRAGAQPCQRQAVTGIDARCPQYGDAGTGLAGKLSPQPFCRQPAHAARRVRTAWRRFRCRRPVAVAVHAAGTDIDYPAWYACPPFEYVGKPRDPAVTTGGFVRRRGVQHAVGQPGQPLQRRAIVEIGADWLRAQCPPHGGLFRPAVNHQHAVAAGQTRERAPGDIAGADDEQGREIGHAGIVAGRQRHRRTRGFFIAISPDGCRRDAWGLPRHPLSAPHLDRLCPK